MKDNKYNKIIAYFMAYKNDDGTIYTNIRGGYPEGTLHISGYTPLNTLFPEGHEYFRGYDDWTKWDMIMPVIEKIHNDFLKDGVEGRDLDYTIKYLLGGGYRFGTSVERVKFTKENLFLRAGMFIEYKNIELKISY